jgi:hypothetical protein
MHHPPCSGSELGARQIEPIECSCLGSAVTERERLGLSCLNLVRKSAGVVDGVGSLAKVVGEGLGGGDGVLSGLDLDLAVAAGGWRFWRTS